MTFLRRGPWKARSPWKGRGPWCAKGPFGVNDIAWTLDATAAAIREAISSPDAWGTTGATTGWRLPGHGGVRLSADAMTGPRLEQQQDGTYRWAAHNLLQYSDAFTTGGRWSAGGTGDPVLAAATAPDGRAAFWLTTGTGAVSTAESAKVIYLSGAYATVSAANQTVAARLRVYSSTATTLGITFFSWGGEESVKTVALTAGQWTWVEASNTFGASAGQVGIGLVVGANASTVWFDAAQLNLGPTALAYVPTAASARYAPAVTWDAALGVWGLRSEPAATNLVLWSADMSNAAWQVFGTGATKVAAATSLGALPMYRVNVGSVGGDASAASAVYQNSDSLPTSQVVTVSAIVRAVSGTSAFRLTCTHNGGVNTAGSADLLATTTPQLFQFTLTTGSGAAGNIAIRAATAGGVVGDIEVGGFQLETGSRATSPIPTFAATVTRTVDAPSNSLATATEGTVVVDYIPAAAGSQNVLSLDDGTANERHLITNDGVYAVTDGGAAQASIDGGTPNVGAVNRVAITWAANRFVASLNGGAVVEDTSGTVPTTTRAVMAEGANVLTTRIRAGARAVPSDRARSLAV